MLKTPQQDITLSCHPVHCYATKLLVEIFEAETWICKQKIMNNFAKQKSKCRSYDAESGKTFFGHIWQHSIHRQNQEYETSQCNQVQSLYNPKSTTQWVLKQVCFLCGGGMMFQKSGIEVRSLDTQQREKTCFIPPRFLLLCLVLRLTYA